MKGTKLWKPAGSPLIQGRSRRERSFFSDSLVGFVLAAVAGIALQALTLMGDGDSLQGLISWALVPVLVGSGVGAPLGVALASAFGWYPRWVCAAITGAVVALGAALLFAGSIR